MAKHRHGAGEGANLANKWDGEVIEILGWQGIQIGKLLCRLYYYDIAFLSYQIRSVL
jgi:hypothetical protein